jgi:glycosyltransferase involved in cell wall biosynthesis
MNIRIALLSHELDLRKGTGIARYSIELSNGLKRRGFDVEVFGARIPDIPYGMAFSHSVLLPLKTLRNARDFDVVHATEPITALSFPVIRSIKIVTFHDLTSILYKRNKSSPHVRASLPALYRLVARSCDKAIAVSTQTKNEIVTYLGIPSEKVEVINHGISDEFRPVRRKERGEYILGYVGALAPRKRLDFAIRAFKQLRTIHPEIEVKFQIWGERSLEYENLVMLVRELSLEEDVEFLGSSPSGELVDIYNSFDLLVFPSDWEGFGFPILEAQKCGTPVLIRSDSKIPHEVSRFCEKATSEEDMADRIYRLITDESIRNPLVERGAEYSRTFTWEAATSRTVALYESMLRR